MKTLILGSFVLTAARLLAQSTDIAVESPSGGRFLFRGLALSNNAKEISGTIINETQQSWPAIEFRIIGQGRCDGMSAEWTLALVGSSGRAAAHFSAAAPRAFLGRFNCSGSRFEVEFVGGISRERKARNATVEAAKAQQAEHTRRVKEEQERARHERARHAEEEMAIRAAVAEEARRAKAEAAVAIKRRAEAAARAKQEAVAYETRRLEAEKTAAAARVACAEIRKKTVDRRGGLNHQGDGPS